MTFSSVQVNNKIVKIYTSHSIPSIGVVSINIMGVHSYDICAILDEKFDITCRGELHCSPLAHKALDTLH